VKASVSKAYTLIPQLFSLLVFWHYECSTFNGTGPKWQVPCSMQTHSCSGTDQHSELYCGGRVRRLLTLTSFATRKEWGRQLSKLFTSFLTLSWEGALLDLLSKLEQVPGLGSSAPAHMGQSSGWFLPTKDPEQRLCPCMGSPGCCL
jgi:hypothetical protein